MSVRYCITEIGVWKTWWHNFITDIATRRHLYNWNRLVVSEQQHIIKINLCLYHAKRIDEFVEFETEEAALLFMLKYA